MRIELELTGISRNEASIFLEWLSYSKGSDGKTTVFMRMSYDSTKGMKGDVLAGPIGDGKPLNKSAKNYLKCTYLMPLAMPTQT